MSVHYEVGLFNSDPNERNDDWGQSLASDNEPTLPNCVDDIAAYLATKGHPQYWHYSHVAIIEVDDGTDVYGAVEFVADNPAYDRQRVEREDEEYHEMAAAEYRQLYPDFSHT